MGRIESFASPEPSGTACPTVPHFAPPVGADASPKGGQQSPNPPQGEVGQVAQRMSDEQREGAICRAAALVEFFHAEHRMYEALWRQHGDFTHKAAFDLAYSNAHTARRLMESLIKGRSPEMVAFLERQRGLDLPACANENQA